MLINLNSSADITAGLIIIGLVTLASLTIIPLIYWALLLGQEPLSNNSQDTNHSVPDLLNHSDVQAGHIG